MRSNRETRRSKPILGTLSGIAVAAIVAMSGCSDDNNELDRGRDDPSVETDDTGEDDTGEDDTGEDDTGEDDTGEDDSGGDDTGGDDSGEDDTGDDN